MTSAGVVAAVIGGWCLVSVLFGLAAGRIIQIYRARCPRLWEIFKHSADQVSPEETRHQTAASSSPALPARKARFGAESWVIRYRIHLHRRSRV